MAGFRFSNLEQCVLDRMVQIAGKEQIVPGCPHNLANPQQSSKGQGKTSRFSQPPPKNAYRKYRQQNLVWNSNVMFRRLVRAPHESQVPRNSYWPPQQRPPRRDTVQRLWIMIVRLSRFKKGPPIVSQNPINPIQIIWRAAENAIIIQIVLKHPVRKSRKQIITSRFCAIQHRPSSTKRNALSRPSSEIVTTRSRSQWHAMAKGGYGHQAQPWPTPLGPPQDDTETEKEKETWAFSWKSKGSIKVHSKVRWRDPAVSMTTDSIGRSNEREVDRQDQKDKSNPVGSPTTLSRQGANPGQGDGTAGVKQAERWRVRNNMITCRMISRVQPCRNKPPWGVKSIANAQRGGLLQQRSKGSRRSSPPGQRRASHMTVREEHKLQVTTFMGQLTIQLEGSRHLKNVYVR